MSRNVYCIELGHNGIKTYYNGICKHYPTMKKAPFNKDEYIKYYTDRVSAIEGVMSMDGVENKDILLRLIVPRYITEKDAKKLENTFDKVTLNNNKLDYEMLIIAQGHGAYIKYLMDNKYSAEDLKNSGIRVVVDFGLNQTQILVFEAGSEKSKLFETVNYGIEHMVLKLQHEVLSQQKDMITYNEAIDLIKKYKNMDDEVYSYREIISDAIDEFLKYLFNFELSPQSADLLKTNIALLSGGGAEFIEFKQFKKYTGNDIGFNVDEPTFADVKGASYVEKFMDIVV